MALRRGRLLNFFCRIALSRRVVIIRVLSLVEQPSVQRGNQYVFNYTMYGISQTAKASRAEVMFRRLNFIGVIEKEYFPAMSEFEKVWYFVDAVEMFGFGVDSTRVYHHDTPKRKEVARYFRSCNVNYGLKKIYWCNLSSYQSL